VLDPAVSLEQPAASTKVLSAPMIRKVFLHNMIRSSLHAEGATPTPFERSVTRKYNWNSVFGVVVKQATKYNCKRAGCLKHTGTSAVS
jgi:hypothetical protein